MGEHPEYTFLNNIDERFGENNEMILGYSKIHQELPPTTLKIGTKPCKLPIQ